MTRGAIEVIAGPMFSGKTEELIRRLHRSELARQTVVAIKPDIDTRYDSHQICSHSGARLAAKIVPNDESGVQAILDIGLSPNHVIGIEEVQFFPRSVVNACRRLRYAGRRVIVAGLDMDYLGEPFGPMPELLAIGDVTKLTAVCHACGDNAQHTFRKTGGDAQILVGYSEHEARCYKCWARDTPKALPC